MYAIKILLRIAFGACIALHLIFLLCNIFTHGTAPLAGYLIIDSLIFVQIPVTLALIIGSSYDDLTKEWYFLFASVLSFLLLGISEAICTSCQF